MNNIVNACRDVSHHIWDMVWVKLALSFILSGMTYMIGEHFNLIGALTVLVIIDFVTGMFASYAMVRPIESRIAVKTPVKWTLYMLMISAAHLADVLVPLNADAFSIMAAAFLGITELISILENIGHAGYAIPLRLLNRLHELRDER